MMHDERARASRRRAGGGQTAAAAAGSGIDRPVDTDMLADVLHGLSSRQKELPPKYFYDERGAALFDEITRLPVYYLTRTERGLLADTVAPWLRQVGARTLVELGAGSGEKTRLLLDALPPGGTYVPVDISAPYLEQIAAELSADYPRLRILPVRSDITGRLDLPDVLPRPVVVAFLGSTIGNLDDRAARLLLRRVRALLHPGDRLLLGVDLRKDRATLEAAYNDPQGVTAEFNRNMLRVLNRELGADFDLAAFRHHAFYDETLGRIEMHLVAAADQVVHIGSHTVRVAAGESIRTEISAKYDEPTVRAMLHATGLALEQWVADHGRYALAIAAPAAAPAPAQTHSCRLAVRSTAPFADEATAAEWLRLHAFPRLPAAREPRIGAEVELIALDADTRAVARYDNGDGPLGRMLHAHARRHGWCAAHSAKGAPRWLLPHGGAITLEPGGQVEYSSPPYASVRELLRDLSGTVEPLLGAAGDAGITLLGMGIDPYNGLAAAPLQIETARYRAMDAYFAALGEAGQRMMRQTASVQLNIDAWHDTVLSWRVLQAVTPCLLALTANSAVYAGAPTGFASYRAATWRELDPSRTGLCTGTDDVALEYARFALAAGPLVDDPFGAGWREHLSTLFPEVRPRGWFELRTPDAVPPARYATVILPVATVLRDARALQEAAELLGPPSLELLERAGRHGLADPELRRRTDELLGIAAAAAARDPAGGEEAEALAAMRSDLRALVERPAGS